MTKIEILNQYKKQKKNTYRECDVINAMEKYLESYKNAKDLQLLQADVSNNEVAVAFVNWLTEKESKYAILYGGTPELEQDYRLATLENDFTIEEVFEQFKKATDY